MIETGDYVDIRFQEERRTRTGRIYWLQAAVVNTARRSACRAPARIWIYRIPSLIGATAPCS